MARMYTDSFLRMKEAGTLPALGRECAWCRGRARQPHDGATASQISHVICSSCLEDQLQALHDNFPTAA